MQCSCGGETISSSHLITTPEAIKDWLEEETDHTEIKVHQNRCNGCKRSFVVIADTYGKILKKRG